MAQAQPEIISSFNTLVGEFLDALAVVFPNERNIPKYKKMLLRVVRTNKRAPIRNFKEQSETYEAYIASKNEEYFLSDNNFMTTLLQEGTTEHTSKEAFLKQWQEIPQESKDTLWEYLQSLFYLGKAFQG